MPGITLILSYYGPIRNPLALEPAVYLKYRLRYINYLTFNPSVSFSVAICSAPVGIVMLEFLKSSPIRYQQKGRLQKLLLEDGSLAEIQHYFI